MLRTPAIADGQVLAPPRTLLRVLGLLFGLAVVVGSVIGSGIMRAPGVVALGITNPTLILLAWAVGGAVAMLMAMPLVEAGSSIPHAGGAYPIVLRAFGPVAGFLTGWVAWLQNAAAADGALPPALAAVSPGGAPGVSVALMVGVSLLFAATGTYESLVRIYAPWSIGAILMICLSAIRLRLTEPDLPRPWRMPLFPWLAIVAVVVQAGLIGLLVWDDPANGAASAVVAIAPLPIYLLLAKRWREQAGRA